VHQERRIPGRILTNTFLLHFLYDCVRDGSVHGRKAVEQGRVCVHVLTHVLVANYERVYSSEIKDMRVDKVDEAYRSFSLNITSAGSLR
jgi:hypothetical protein